MGIEPRFQMFLHKHILTSDQMQRTMTNICSMNIKEITNCGHERFLEAKQWDLFNYVVNIGQIKKEELIYTSVCAFMCICTSTCPDITQQKIQINVSIYRGNTFISLQKCIFSYCSQTCIVSNQNQSSFQTMLNSSNSNARLEKMSSVISALIFTLTSDFTAQ